MIGLLFWLICFMMFGNVSWHCLLSLLSQLNLFFASTYSPDLVSNSIFPLCDSISENRLEESLQSPTLDLISPPLKVVGGSTLNCLNQQIDGKRATGKQKSSTERERLGRTGIAA